MNWRQVFKQRFPYIFEYYKHYRRRKTVKFISNLQEKSIDYLADIVSERYRRKFGHELDWNNLRTYTEKMQWEKLYDTNPKKTLYSDKYLVREWVSSVIGEEYLIPLLGVWDCFDDIDFNQLPNRFVLKTNHGSGTNLIVKDKRALNYQVAKCKFDDWMDIDFGYVSMELHYSKIKRKIIAEKYIETAEGELQDYKFLCFNGEPHYCWVDMGRFSEHTRNVYDLEWNLQPWSQETYLQKDYIPKPQNFNQMIDLARVLSKGFAHVRVDLYNINGKIYFGEMTFTNGGGFDRILPEKYDRMLGDLWSVDS